MRAAIAISPDETARRLDIARIARGVVLGEGYTREAVNLIEKSGASRQLMGRIKANEVPGGGTSGGWGGELSNADSPVAAFLGSLQSRSVFLWALFNGAFRVPLNTRAVAATTAPTATIVDAGDPAPVSAMVLAGQTVGRRKAVSIVGMSNELLRDASSLGSLQRELEKAVARSADADFLTGISTSPAVSIVSSGVDDASIKIDIQTLIAAVNSTGDETIILAIAPDAASILATHDDGHGEFSPTGLSRLYGVPALVTAATGSGVVVAIDVSGIAAGAETVEFSRGSETSIQMSSAPDGTALTSLFAMDATAIKAAFSFGYQRFRSSVAVMTGLTSGGSS